MRGKIDIMDDSSEARLDITGVPYDDAVIDAADVVTVNGFRFIRERFCHDENGSGRNTGHFTCSECGALTAIPDIEHIMRCPSCHGLIESPERSKTKKICEKTPKRTVHGRNTTE